MVPPHHVVHSAAERGQGLGAHPLSPGLSSTPCSATSSVRSDELPADAISADAYRFSTPLCGPA